MYLQAKASECKDLTAARSGCVQLELHEGFTGVEHAWRSLEREGTASVYQRFDFVAHWATRIGASRGFLPRLILATRDDDPLFILPLASVRRFGLHTLQWLADDHSNFQTGLYSRAFLADFDPSDFRDLVLRATALIGGVDLLDLCCQPEAWNGYRNPMLTLGSAPAVNSAYALDLEGGFEAALARINGGKRRKKYRAQMNKLGDASRVRLICAEGAAEARPLMRKAFADMAVRFEALGIPNRFSDPCVTTFFEDLAGVDGADAAPLLRVYALEIDGIVRASLTGGVSCGTFSGYFLSLAQDEMTHLSPGELLLHEAVRHAANEGLSRFDLGRGRERYKTSWCNREIAMFDTRLPLTATGRMFATAMQMTSDAKRRMRNHPLVWNRIKTARAALRKSPLTML